MDFELRIVTKQQIYTRKVNEVNHIDVSNCDEYQEVEVNEVHVRNHNYKGKKYDPNYQNRNKNNNHFNNISSNQSGSSYNKSYNSNSGGNFNNNKAKSNENPANLQVTLTEPVNKDQMFKIQEILRNPTL